MKLLDREIRKHKKLLLVDGYNVINSWDILKNFDDTKLEEARRMLINIMMEYTHYTDEGVVLVFDSYNVKTDRQVVIEEKLMIVYTRELETADHFIEKMAEKYANKKILRVATSDRLEQDIVLGKGGSRMSSKELEYEVMTAKKDIDRIRENDKVKNRLHLGGLNEDFLIALEKFKKSMED